MSELSKPVRSRGGCSNCRKLKIKCNEAKPSCEYCQHTHRECEYLPPKPRKPRTKFKIREIHGEEPSRIVVDPRRVISDLNVQSIINSPSQQLGLTRLELRLLNFFNLYCIELFTYGMSKEVDNVWRHEVPSLFMSSNLVRSAVFSFSCINLWPLCDLISLRDLDRDFELSSLHLKRDRAGHFTSSDDASTAVEPVFHKLYNVPLDSEESSDTLYVKTASYFLDSVRASQQKVMTAKFNENSNEKFEIIISGIIIFAFLCIHPHKLMPLVNFGEEENFIDEELSRKLVTDGDGNPDSPYGPDFLSFCRGFELSLMFWRDDFASSRYRNLLTNPLRKRPISAKFPVILALKQQLSDIYKFSDISSTTSNDIITLTEAIFLMESSLNLTTVVNYPVPFLTCILHLNEEFHFLVRKKNQFALRLLFFFSLFSLLLNINLFPKTNMWTDYIEWFRLHYPLTSFDEKLYYLAVTKSHRVQYLHYKLLTHFDPEVVYDNLMEGIKDPILA